MTIPPIATDEVLPEDVISMVKALEVYAKDAPDENQRQVFNWMIGVLLTQARRVKELEQDRDSAGVWLREHGWTYPDKGV